MGWFGNNEKNDESERTPSLPELPRLPELPALPSNRQNNLEPLPPLPSFPSGRTGDRFSQNSIKHAVSGNKEGDDDEAEDYDEELPRLPNQKIYEEIPEGYEIADEEFQPEIPSPKKRKHPKSNEPVFIRLDKFEDAMKIFEETKKKINEIEGLLEDTRKLKESEESELESWENEIKSIKSQIEKIDQDVFSRIE